MSRDRKRYRGGERGEQADPTRKAAYRIGKERKIRTEPRRPKRRILHAIGSEKLACVGREETLASRPEITLTGPRNRADYRAKI